MFTDKLRDTKLRLLATLKDYNFDTKKDEVVEVVNELSALWRESLAFSTEKDFVPSKSNLFIGEWKNYFCSTVSRKNLRRKQT